MNVRITDAASCGTRSAVFSSTSLAFRALNPPSGHNARIWATVSAPPRAAHARKEACRTASHRVAVHDAAFLVELLGAGVHLADQRRGGDVHAQNVNHEQALAH